MPTRTSKKLTRKKPIPRDDFVSGDFVELPSFSIGNPFANPQFIEAMYVYLLSMTFRPRGICTGPRSECQVEFERKDLLALEDLLPAWRQALLGRKDLLNDYYDVLAEVDESGTHGLDVEPSVVLKQLPKLLAIGHLLRLYPGVEEDWARVYDLYATAREQRREYWRIPELEKEWEAQEAAWQQGDAA